MTNKSLKNTRTRANLMKAFAGESMARNRYLMFASIAEKENLIEIANIFRETADNEKEHAEVYFKFLDGEEVQILNATYPSCYGNTELNLACASKYEDEEHSYLYPEFGKIAEEEGFKTISKAFFDIASIEGYHSKRYSKMHKRLTDGFMFKSETKIIWQCTHCGFMYENETPPEKCPVCSKSQGYYKIYKDCD
jgi:rubrerythrin